jgi:hypothetical protein
MRKDERDPMDRVVDVLEQGHQTLRKVSQANDDAAYIVSFNGPTGPDTKRFRTKEAASAFAKSHSAGACPVLWPKPKNNILLF